MAFVIKEHRPARLPVIILVALVLFALSIWGSYRYGWNQAAREFDYEFEKNKPLHEQLAAMTETNRDINARMAILERTAQVDREAKVELAHEIRTLQENSAELREEVAFYKSIISPDKGKSGLSVYSFEAVKADETLYHYKMILTQAGKSDSLAEGGVDISVTGVLNGKEKVLNFSDIRVPGDSRLTYKFHYFQELGGSLQFPESFLPREVVIKLSRKKGNKIKNPVKRFDWLDVRA